MVDEVLRLRMQCEPALSTEGYAARRADLKAQLLASFFPGCVVAVVQLLDVKTDATFLTPRERVWCEPGKKWWHLGDDVRRLSRPVPCRGMQGLWELPADVERRVREQTGLELPSAPGAR